LLCGVLPAWPPTHEADDDIRVALLAIASSAPPLAAHGANRVAERVTELRARRRSRRRRRVDTIGGKPFTSYIYPTSLKKPVLYPLGRRVARS
jgi:hypothetical protein